MTRRTGLILSLTIDIGDGRRVSVDPIEPALLSFRSLQGPYPLSSVEIDEALAKAIADHGRYVLAPEAPKKTAQWKQNPLSRYRK